MNPSATSGVLGRRFFVLLIAGLSLALAAGLWMLERTGAGATPVSHISAVAVSHKNPHPHPKPKPCGETKHRDDDCIPRHCTDDSKRHTNDNCKPKHCDDNCKPKHCDDDRKRHNDDDCRP